MWNHCKTVIGLVVVLPAVALAQAPGGSIGVFADAAGTSTEISLPLFATAQAYILYKHNPDNAPGEVNGAEFRVTGKPASGLVITVTRSPHSNLTFGLPFSDESLPEGERGGCNIAFPECQAVDANGIVLLYTVQLTSIELIEGVQFTVDRRDPPSNPFDGVFPHINACDSPVFTKVQVDGLTTVINKPITTVETRSWGAVKRMFH